MRYPQTDREFQEAEEARERTRKSDEADFDNYGARQNSILHFSCGIDLDPEELISPSPKTAPAPIAEQPCDCGHPDCTWCELLDETLVHGPYRGGDYLEYWDLTDADLRPDDEKGKDTECCQH